MVSNQAVESAVTVDYTTTKALALEIDPIATCRERAFDFEGYIYVKELSGNDINVEFDSVIDDIEYTEYSVSPLSANSVATFVISKPVRHRVYITGTASGQAKVAYRIICYGGG